MISDERAEKIRKQAEIHPTGLIIQCASLQRWLKELLTDRAERIRDKEAVIAKIKEIADNPTKHEENRLFACSNDYDKGWVQACDEILDSIRNPKED